MLIDVFLNGVPTRRRSSALFDQLRTSITTGRLAPGDRLPTSRDLAVELGVARSTVATVYSRLIAEGYTEARVGDGTFVARHPAIKPTPRTTTANAIRVARPAPPTDAPPAAPAGGWRVDLRTGRPDPSLFPLTEWRQAVTGSLHHPPPGYGDLAGHPELRTALAAWITRSRGVNANPDHILVTAGAQGAFDLCARALIDTGDTVAVENPGYAPARQVFELHGAHIAPTPVDRDGIDVDRIPQHARLVVVTPSHQSPTGAVLSASRRRQLLHLAATRNLVIIEDDYDTEYRYIDRPLEPLHRLDTTGHVIYVGSFAKTLSPSLRLGCLVAPPPVIEALTRTRHLVDTQPPHLTQAALASFLTSGAFDRHLRRTRRIYRNRRDHLTRLLDHLADDGLIAPHPPCNAGLHTTIELRPHVDAETLAANLQRDGFAVTTTSESWIGPPQNRALTIGFGLADEHQLTLTINALRRRLQPRPRTRKE